MNSDNSALILSDTEKLYFKTENYKGVNMIYVKAYGLQEAQDVQNVMDNFTKAIKFEGPSIGLVDVRDMKATMNKNILELAQFVRNDLINLRILGLIFQTNGIKDFGALIATFVGFTPIDIDLENYKMYLSRINNDHSYMFLVDGSPYPTEPDNRFSPFDVLFKEFADKVAEMPSK